MQERMIGTVKWFNPKKGYGFAVNENGEDVLISHRVMRITLRKTIKPGDQLTFTQERTDKGWQAAEVELMQTV